MATVLLQRFNQDSQQWETLQTRSLGSGGVLSDHFFDHTVPQRWGGCNYRIHASDGDGQPLGIATIIAMGMCR